MSGPARLAAAFPLALEFLTVVRLRRSPAFDLVLLGLSLIWFPVVGALLGVTLLLLHTGALRVFPPPVAAALTLTAWVLLTGALHLDGLADSADALFGGHTAERRLAILKDSRIGVFGAVAVALWLLLLWSTLLGAGNDTPDRAVRLALLTGPPLARAAMALNIAAFPYARPQGLGRAYRDSVTRPVLIATLLAAAVISYVTFGLEGVALALGAALIALAFGRWASGRLGGLTGDLYGATGALVEAAVALAATGDLLRILRVGYTGL